MCKYGQFKEAKTNCCRKQQKPGVLQMIKNCDWLCCWWTKSRWLPFFFLILFKNFDNGTVICWIKNIKLFSLSQLHSSFPLRKSEAYWSLLFASNKTSVLQPMEQCVIHSHTIGYYTMVPYTKSYYRVQLKMHIWQKNEENNMEYNISL